MSSADIQAKLEVILGDHIEIAGKTFQSSRNADLVKVAEAIIQTLQKGGKLLICGNGGSAADSQHIAAEFIARFKKERKSLPAIALTTDSSILTALANDYNYDCVFKRQVEGLGRKGDLLIAISTSGNSKNVIEAVKAAQQIGLKTVSFTGEKGGALKPMTDLNFSAASNETSHIQEMHITALHAVSEIAEEVLSK